MKSLGLNPGEQEMIDMTNEVANNGLVYFPDFCKIVLRKYREDNRELLNQSLFKVNMFGNLACLDALQDYLCALCALCSLRSMHYSHSLCS